MWRSSRGGVGGGGLGKDVFKLEVDSVGPTEANDVALIAGGDFDIGRAAGYVVLLAKGAVADKVVEYCRGKFGCDARGVVVEAVAVEARDGEPGDGRPAVGGIPLNAGEDVAGLQAAALLEEVEMASVPQRPARGWRRLPRADSR
jgi:hypothetical protein